MQYGGFKNLPRAVDQVLHKKEFNITKNPKYDGYQHRLSSLFHKLFSKQTFDGAVKSEVMPKQQLAKELQELTFKKFQNQKLHSHFIDNSCGADLAGMHLIIKFNKIFPFLLYVNDIQQICMGCAFKK